MRNCQVDRESWNSHIYTYMNVYIYMKYQVPKPQWNAWGKSKYTIEIELAEWNTWIKIMDKACSMEQQRSIFRYAIKWCLPNSKLLLKQLLENYNAGSNQSLVNADYNIKIQWINVTMNLLKGQK